MNKILAITFLLFVLSLFGSSLCCAANYYVDFDSGSDANAGTTTGTAWQHAPEDPNATGVSDATTLQPADVVLFRGGVVYRGSVKIEDSGTTGSPITYQGSGWGEERAILDGSDVLPTTWTQCTGPEDCGGNANWEEIWYTDAPVGFDIFQPIYEDDEFLWFSQDPNPEQPIFYNRYQYFRVIPLALTTVTMTRTSITDPRIFTQTDPDYWEDAYALVWRQPDIVVAVQVTSFSTALDTIYIEDIGGEPYTDRDTYYAMMGHISLIDVPGEFSYTNDKIYAWPHNSDDPTGHDYFISERKVGFDIYVCQQIVIEGFEIRGFHALDGEANDGAGIYVSWNDTVYNVTIRDNYIHHLRSVPGTAAIFIAYGSRYRIEDNHVYWCQGNKGIACITENVFVDDNIVDSVGGTGILFLTCTYGRITGNLVQNILGGHANGVTVYLDSTDILVAHNKILVGGANIAFTTNETDNVYIIGNLMDGLSEGYVFRCWDGGGYMGGTNPILLNTIVRESPSDALGVGAETPPTFIMQNTIVGGGVVVNRSYNLYTSLGIFQNAEADPPWYIGTGEIINEDTDAAFVDYDNGDFHLKAGSDAIGSGVDVSSLFPTELFPDYDFTVDLDGVTRDFDDADIGAFEYVGDAPTPPTPSGNLVMIRKGI